jgi:hypothetical protein
MKTLVVYPQYGLANRLRAIASAKILADHTGRRLIINWVPCERECNVRWVELFMNQVERYPLPLSGFQPGVNFYDDTGKPGFYWDMPHSLVQNKSDVVALRTFRNIRPKWMTEGAFKRSKSLFYKSLKPVSAVQEAVSDIEDRYFRNNHVIGIHMRRTDHFSWNSRQDPGSVSPTELFIRRMRRILKDNSKTKFFLSTDDKNEEKVIKNLFPDAVIVYEKDAMSRLTRKGMQDALIDWLLLSKTCTIIGSYRSSFNEEAGIVHMTKVETISKRAIFLNFKAYHKLVKTEGLEKVLLYSYYYRKQKLLDLIKKKLNKVRRLC